MGHSAFITGLFTKINFFNYNILLILLIIKYIFFLIISNIAVYQVWWNKMWDICICLSSPISLKKKCFFLLPRKLKISFSFFWAVCLWIKQGRFNITFQGGRLPIVSFLKIVSFSLKCLVLNNWRIFRQQISCPSVSEMKILDH